LSGGQKTLTDLVLLEKLIQLAGGLGLIIFDETFKFLDGENLEKVVDVLKHMHCSSIFIVSHVEGFPYWDASIHTSLDENNATRYTIR
jgi:DNA repair exonuclease SbcCD ATPase subunit